jgi:hypothetical protein
MTLLKTVLLTALVLVTLSLIGNDHLNPRLEIDPNDDGTFDNGGLGGDPNQRYDLYTQYVGTRNGQHIYITYCGYGWNNCN